MARTRPSRRIGVVSCSDRRRWISVRGGPAGCTIDFFTRERVNRGASIGSRRDREDPGELAVCAERACSSGCGVENGCSTNLQVYLMKTHRYLAAGLALAFSISSNLVGAG